MRRPRTAPRAKPSPAPEETAVIAIERITAGGDGIGRVDGLACFVPRTAPGDVAQVVYRRSARLARGRVLQLREPSTERVEPRCRHYVADRCGGCQLQHLEGDAQRRARTGIVADALQRIARRNVDRPVLTAGPEWHYRGRLTLTLLRRGERWIGGLHPYDDPTRVFALEECPISHPALVEAWHGVRPGVRGLPDAPSLRLGFRLAADGRVALVVTGGRVWPQQESWTQAAREAHPNLQAVHWEPVADPSGPARVDDGGHVDDLAPEAAEALAFAQVNAEIAARLRTHVMERVRELNPASVIDGYAGTGLLTEALVAHGIRVTAIELDAAATARARDRLADAPLATVVTARVEDGLPRALPADVVVLNPPRRGVDAAVTAQLADARGVHRIVYVSCDPSTLARDLGRLPRWRVDSLHCFDMFPQTAHVETVCVLTPEEP